MPTLNQITERIVGEFEEKFVRVRSDGENYILWSTPEVKKGFRSALAEVAREAVNELKQGVSSAQRGRAWNSYNEGWDDCVIVLETRAEKFIGGDIKI